MLIWHRYVFSRRKVLQCIDNPWNLGSGAIVTLTSAPFPPPGCHIWSFPYIGTECIHYFFSKWQLFQKFQGNGENTLYSCLRPKQGSTSTSNCWLSNLCYTFDHYDTFAGKKRNTIQTRKAMKNSTLHERKKFRENFKAACVNLIILFLCDDAL